MDQAKIEAQIKESVKEIEASRKQFLKTWISTHIQLILFVVGWFAFMFVALIVIGSEADIIRDIAFYTLLIFGLFIGRKTYLEVEKARHEYISDYKLKIILTITNQIFPGLRYFGTTGMLSEECYQAKIMGKKFLDMEYFSDDLFQGKVDDIDIQMADVRLIYGHHVPFSGLIVRATFNKNFEWKTQVYPKKFKYSGKSNVQMDDLRFNQKFQVCSENQTEARYLLSPTLMERLINFSNRTKHKVIVSFYNQNIYIAVNTRKKHFEPRFLKKNRTKKIIQETVDAVKLSEEIVKDLNLNFRIWGV